MAETREQKLSRELSHRESYSQTDPRLQRYLETSERDNPPIGLEQPLITPLDLLGPAHVKGALNLIKMVGKGYSKLAAEAIARSVEGGSPLTALAQPAYVIKNKGGNWLNGSIEDALSGLKRPTTQVPEGTSPEVTARWAALNAKKEPINSWIDKQLTRYVKNDMATPEDPVRALAERGVLHIEPQHHTVSRREAAAAGNRGHAGSTANILGQSPLARTWETLSDSEVRPGTYTSLMPSAFKKDNLDNLRDLGGEFAAVNPHASAYQFGNWGDSGASRVLGFDHLIDELSNATNPASGLPRGLLLSPESLSKVSVPQAVELVAKINAWRAAQKAEADMLSANNAATVLHKEYPDKGMKWVELRAPEEALSPETAERLKIYGEQHVKDQVVAAGRTALQDALKYEGDTMGHCVGGYCDDVLSGRTKVYSLRDAKGQPHVTVEVKPPVHTLESLNGEIEATGGTPRATWEEAVAEYRKKFPMSADNVAASASPTIKQIKGKQNRKPNDEYLPFVQDFVSSGKWSDVGDLENAGLRRTIDAFNSNELKMIQDAGIDVPQWATPDDIRTIRKRVWPSEEFASGGQVTALSWDLFAE